jgi:hypothetical protein
MHMKVDMNVDWATLQRSLPQGDIALPTGFGFKVVGRSGADGVGSFFAGFRFCGS